MNPYLRHAIRVSALLVLALAMACSDSTGPEGSSHPELILFHKGVFDMETGSLVGDIYTIAPDGSGLTQLTFTGDAVWPAWSPDGEQIVFGRLSEENPNLFVMNADGSDLHQVTEGFAAKAQPKWSPDGNRLIFVQAAPAYLGTESAFYTVPVEGGEQTVVAPCDCQWPVYSPDGTRIAYVAWVPEADDPGVRVPSIHIMNSDGSGKTNLLPQGTWGHRPAWTPDGSRIIFPGVEGTGPAYDIYSMAPDGSDLTRITTTGHLGYVGPSPDGTRLVVEYQNQPSDVALYVLNVDGTEMTPLVDDGAANLFPSWRP